MRTRLETVDLGPISVAAPPEPPRHVVAQHGHLWQWVGDGRELISLSVTVRATRLGTPTGVRHHLAWQIADVRSTMALPAQDERATDVLVQVAGAVGAAAADVTGDMHGAHVHNRLVVTSDERHMHVVRVLVPDNEVGRALCEAVTAALQVRSGGIPA